MAKIYLSPSSQERNLGVVSGYIEEAVCNRIADAAQKILVAAGQEVMRNNPSNPYNVHTDESNAWGADIHAPIHTNAAAATARGARVGCYAPDDKSLESTKLAQAVFDRLAPVTPATTDYLVKYTFDEVTRTKAKCVYTEVSFHSNLEDTQWILANIDLIGKTIALGILDYLGIEYKEATLPPPNWEGQMKDKDAQIAALTADMATLRQQVATALAERDGYVAEVNSIKSLVHLIFESVDKLKAV